MPEKHFMQTLLKKLYNQRKKSNSGTVFSVSLSPTSQSTLQYKEIPAFFFSIYKAIGKDNRLVIRSDNGTQMTSHQFRKYVEGLGIHHEFTPFSCPEKNAHIEAFFSLYEIEFLQTRYFRTLREAVRKLSSTFVVLCLFFYSKS